MVSEIMESNIQIRQGIMKSRIFRYMGIVVLVAGLMALAVSCRKKSPNGKLDGMWRIMTVENKSTGEVVTPEGQYYYCMNLHVVQLQGNPGADGNMQYSKSEGEVTMDFPYVGNTINSASNPYKVYGIWSSPVTFKVVTLNGKRLVLESPESVVTMRRF